MTGREFADKYAGQLVEICNDDPKYNGLTGRVVGMSNGDYYSNYIYIEVTLEPLLCGHKPPFDYMVVPQSSIKGRIYFEHIKNLKPFPISIPDDCLDCGATGNEPCKDNCPNKE